MGAFNFLFSYNLIFVKMNYYPMVLRYLTLSSYEIQGCRFFKNPAIPGKSSGKSKPSQF